MKRLLLVVLLCSSVAHARGLTSLSAKLSSRTLQDATIVGGVVAIVATSIYVSSVQRTHLRSSSQAEASESRDYESLVQQLSIDGVGIDSDDSGRYVDGENLSATDYDGLMIYYVQGVLHTSGTAIAVPELGSQVLLVKKDGAFNQLIHTDQIVGVAIDDNIHRGLPIAVLTEESEYEWQPVPHEITADLEAIIQRGHLIHGDVLQQFTGGQLLVASSYTIDKDGKVTPLENPRNIFAPADKVTWFDPEATIPTATKCEQCHDAEFPNED